MCSVMMGTELTAVLLQQYTYIYTKYQQNNILYE